MLNQRIGVALVLLGITNHGSALDSQEFSKEIAKESAEKQPMTSKSDPLSFLNKEIEVLTASQCTYATDCSDYPYYDCDAGQCVHKAVFPQEPLEWVGIFVFGFIMALCTVAGIGGGGIANSMLLAFFKFETKPAVAISSFSILVCTTMRFFYNFRTRNPDKPSMNVLDYGLASIMMPTTLAGSQIGGYILLIFPALYIQIFLTILLGYLSWVAIMKGLQLHRKEKAEAEKRSQSVVVEEDVGESFMSKAPQRVNATLVESEVTNNLSTISNSKIASQLREPSNEIEQEGNESKARANTIEIAGQIFELGKSEEEDAELNELKAIAVREDGQSQFVKQGICALLLACIILINILEPSQSEDSPIGIQLCSAVYWLMQIGFVGMCFFMTYLSIKINSKEQKLKIKYGVNYKEGDVLFEGRALIILVSIGFVGGLVAGALGLGGGSIYNPALLSLGVHPRVSGATGMFLVLFSTVNTCLINFLNGYLDIYYAMWISAFSLLGSVLGMALTDKVVAVTGKPSIMVWVLVFVFIISTISTPIFASFSLKSEAEDGTDIYAFNGVCTP